MQEEKSQYQLCMWHGTHNTKIKHLEKDMARTIKRLDDQDKRMDKMAVEHAKLTGKIVGVIGLAQILVQVALKFVG